MDANEYRLWNPFTNLEEFLPHAGLGPMTIVRGEGPYVYNERGEKFINGSSCLWNVALGHGREELVEAACEQMRTLAYASCFQQTHPVAIELADKLCEITDGRYAKAYLGSNGTEAVETAFKIARQYYKQSKDQKKRYKIFSFTGSYHGVSLGAISASGEAVNEEKYGPLLQGFIHIDPPNSYERAYGSDRQDLCEDACLKCIKEQIEAENPETIAAFIAEPIMGENGVLNMSDAFLEALVKLCHDYGMLFIADEVTTGFGRTGRLFVSEAWTESPDILCMGKGISSGYQPLSATLATAKIYENFKGKDMELLHGSTASGHPVCAAVGLANIDIMEKEDIIDHVEKTGAYLKEKLCSMQKDCAILGDVRGRGLMIGLEIVEDKETREPLDEKGMFFIVADAAAMGLLLYYNKNVIGLYPTLTITKEIADEIVAILSKALDTSKIGKLSQKTRLAKTMLKASQP